MTCDPNVYKNIIPTMRHIYEKTIHKGIQETVSSIATGTGAKALAVALIIEHLYGSSPELTAQIQSLIKFYKYDIIIPMEK